MCKYVFLAGFILLALNLKAWSQPGDEDTRKQALKLAESLKGKYPNQQAYLKLMAMKPIPIEIESTLRKVVATESVETCAVAAALLVEIVPPDAKLVKPLADGLLSKNAFVGVAAMKALVKLGPLAKAAKTEYLIAMDAAPPPVRGAGVALAEIMGKDAILPLEQTLIKSTPTKRNDQAAMALGKIGSEAVPTILKLLNMDDPLMDIYVGKALKAMDKQPFEVLKPIQRFANHKDGNVRRSYYEYLAGLSPATDAINALLLQGLNDSSGAVVCMAALRKRTTDVTVHPMNLAQLRSTAFVSISAWMSRLVPDAGIF